jgi:hypothetical protein
MFWHAFGSGPPLFQIFFIVILAFIIFNIVRSATNYTKNASSPILEDRATLVSKRTHITGHSHMHGQHGHMHHSSRTQYYMTFEFEDGQRLELVANGRQYGQLVEGDTGVLTFQGEWFKDFNRE